MLRALLILVATAIPSAASATPRSAYIVTPTGDEAVHDAAAAGPLVIYLNRDGGTYRPGPSDASVNTTTLVDQVATVPPWTVSADGWQEVVGCVEQLLSRWHVEVTDQDPGAAPHLEVVVAGRPEDLGMPGHYGGVAPMRSDCRVIPEPIVFTFAELFGTATTAVCEVSAQEIAHTLGLDHELLCSDPMSYLRCGAKSFQDVEAPCGEDVARECLCGGPTQSSVAMLDERLGAAGEGNPAPSVAIVAPLDGAEVGPGFTVTAEASDNVAVDRVELVIDGEVVAAAEGAPFTFATGASLAAGAHTIEVRAIDFGGASNAAAIAVEVVRGGEPGPEADDPDEVDAPLPLGCSAGGGSGGLALGLLALGLRRRRRGHRLARSFSSSS